LKLEDHWALTLEKNREVKQHFSAPDVQDEILFDLVETLKRSPFPFRSCPICRTIFVPVRKQKYCSPACTARAFSSAENPARREYMRKFVAKQREKANTQNRAVKKQPTKRG